MCVVDDCDVKLLEDEVGLGTDELRLAKISMTATTTRGKVRGQYQSLDVSSTLDMVF